MLPFVTVMLFVAAAFLIAAQIQTQMGPQSIHVDLSAPAATPQARESTDIRFVVAPVWSPERTYWYYDELAEYVAARSDRRVGIVQRHTYAEVVELLRDGGAQAGIIGTGTYLHARREGIPLEAVAVPLRLGRPHYFALLLVRSDSPYETMDDLERRSFGFTDPLSLSGHFYPLSMLIEQGEDPATYFSSTVYTRYHDASIAAVRDGIVDAVAVNSLVYEYEVERNPVWETTLRVIHRSPPLAISPVVVPARLDPVVRQTIEEALLTMHQSPRGREILRRLRFDRFVAPPPGLFDGSEEIVDHVETHPASNR